MKKVFWHIKDRVVWLVICCIILTTGIISSVGLIITHKTANDYCITNVKNNAVLNAKTIDSWFTTQGGYVNTMAKALSMMDYEDTESIQNYIESCWKENDAALMYYVCYDFDGGVYPADHSKLDLDPTTRSWWIDAQNAGHLVYTDPYQDYATGSMIISATVPYKTKPYYRSYTCSGRRSVPP